MRAKDIDVALKEVAEELNDKANFVVPPDPMAGVAYRVEVMFMIADAFKSLAKKLEEG